MSANSDLVVPGAQERNDKHVKAWMDARHHPDGYDVG